MGDPHIISNKTNKEVGIYQIVFDNEGNQIRHHVEKQTFNEAYLDTVQQTYFKDKNWMIMYTDNFKQNLILSIKEKLSTIKTN